jgi:RNA polymerase sigma factor (sigma-70 family)
MSLAMAEKKQNIIQTVKDYGRQLFSFIRGRVNTEEDAEDILQDVWYQLSSQARLEDIESISGWLYRVARNKITDTYRKKKEASLDNMDTANEEDEWTVPSFMLDSNPDAEMVQLQKIFRQSLFDALQELPDNQRQVFIWNEIQEMTLQEIADQEHQNIKTIISRKRYAVQHLRRRLEFLHQDFLND